MKMKYLLPIAMLFMIIAMSPSSNSMKANAAAGVNGKLSVGVNSVLLDSPVAIKVYDMDVGADYSIHVDSVNWFNWTNGAAESEKVFYRTFTEDDVTSNVIKIELFNGSTAKATALDTLYVTPTTVDTFFPDELIFALFVPILIAVILVAIVLVIRGRRR